MPPLDISEKSTQELNLQWPEITERNLLSFFSLALQPSDYFPFFLFLVYGRIFRNNKLPE